MVPVPILDPAPKKRTGTNLSYTMLISRIVQPLWLLIVGLALFLFEFALRLIRWAYAVLPIAILGHLGLKFTVGTFTNAPRKDEYQLLFSMVGLSATICGLVLRMAAVSKDVERGSKYYDIGEDLFYGTLLFVLALAVRYSYARFSQGSEWLASFTRLPLGVVGILMFCSALVLIYSALKGLNSQLEKLIKDPFRQMFGSMVEGIRRSQKRLTGSAKAIR